MQIESIGVSQPQDQQRPDTLQMLREASVCCLESSQFSKKDIELLISVGVYRTEFLTEPAIAALLAGELALSSGNQSSGEDVPLAFDLLNGSVGFLNACYLISELARAGDLERAMIVASEIENNSDVATDDLVGVSEMGSAVVLHPATDGESGFQAFGFYDYTEHLDVNVVVAKWDASGRCYLKVQRKKDLLAIYHDCVQRGARQFLSEQGLTTSDIRWLLPPQISAAFVSEVTSRLGFSEDNVIDVTSQDLDLATSATPLAIQAAQANARLTAGDLGLIVNVGSGVQVACALYQF
jgi:3-oxoacyl-[acyl-carrier-protein] synthase III